MRRYATIAFGLTALLPMGCSGGRQAPSAVSSDAKGKQVKADVDVTINAAMDHLTRILSLKNAQPPFVAVYEINKPDPRSFGTDQSWRIIRPDAKTYYSEHRCPNFESRCLITSDSAYFEHRETLGTALGRCRIQDAPPDPDAWLQERAFIGNACQTAQEGVNRGARAILAGAKVVDVSQTGSETTLEVQSRQGQALSVRMHDTGLSIVMRTVVNGEAQNKVLVNFELHSQPAGEDLKLPRDFAARVTAEVKDEEVVEAGSFSHDLIIEKAFAKLRAIRDVSFDEAKAIAVQYGYLVPRDWKRVQKAVTYFGQLSLDVQIDGRVYSLHQFPKANTSDLPENYVTNKRQLGEWAVKEITDVGVAKLGGRSVKVYYLWKDFMIITDGAAKFRDDDLDRFVLTMEPAS